ncbi:hypothetical protein [Archangium primigenium]|uniref:hypothetical protein n=1 Tax=[Archangium] primigenium TaxID=2792470 RepID=UPI001958C6F4|nr:hypothetical protein [Archangium primigenium]MBM7112665.1 hypothetical protein [Archangium primigenium]
MLVLPLALLLSTTPPAVMGWAGRACTTPKQTPQSTMDLKVREEEHAECLRKAMGRALDKVLASAKAGAAGKRPTPALAGQVLALQADYERWVSDACAVMEEVTWMDVSTGERFMGTGYGLTRSECQQRQFAWRGFYLDVWARGEWSALGPVFEAQGGAARTARQFLLDHRTQVQRAASLAPAHGAAAALPGRKLSQADWSLYLERLARVLSAPESLARRQCEVLPSAAQPTAEACVQRFADSLLAPLDFPESARAASRRPASP